MQVFRLTRKKYAIELSGKGAAITGARWNSKGTALIYTSATRALAMAEVFIHLSINKIPSDFVMLEVNIPESLQIDKIHSKELFGDWNEFPYRLETQQLGDAFVYENHCVVVQVPSVVVPGDFNYLINPHYPDFSKIKIENYTNFPMDDRLFNN